MALEMREKCERELSPGDDAYICTYECTFCADCTDKMNSICPNCGGELVHRPKRKKT
jgi:hypothetical protein